MRLSLTTILLLFTTILFSQGFTGSLLLGSNASQIDGDNFAGYKKIGLHGGARVSYVQQGRWQPSIEFLYSQRGSRNNVIPNKIFDVHIDLKYIEIPLIFAFRDWKIEEGNYYKVRAEGGVSYGRIIGKSSSIDALGTAIENVKDNDISMLLGVGYKFNQKWGMGFRYTRSLIKLYNNENSTVESLLSYFLTCRAEYDF